MSLQNLGEAEYVVSVFQYMRLRGYPADKISILTTYNGQRALISDVVERRCANHPAFGRPLKVCLLLCFGRDKKQYGPACEEMCLGLRISALKLWIVHDYIFKEMFS